MATTQRPRVAILAGTQRDESFQTAFLYENSLGKNKR